MPTYQNPNPDLMGDVQAAIAAGAALGEVRGIPEGARQSIFTVLPKDYEIHNLEDFLVKPLRIRQHVKLEDAGSFIAYLKEFSLPDSLLFFATESETFEAVIDYHQKGAPDGSVPPEASWCDHVVTFQPRRSTEFAAWLAGNRKQMGQVEFARFLEENLPDVVEPAGAELLEIALTFEAKKDVEFASGVRLSNGQIQFTYNEVVRGAAQKGTLEVPEQFVLGIPIHQNGDAYRIPVRLRWRLHEGKAIFWYEIVRPQRFIDDAIREMRAKIAAETNIRILTGAPR